MITPVEQTGTDSSRVPQTVGTSLPLHPADVRLPMVEVFQTIEGEGMAAGFPTTFVRVYNCNLRCTWCDTPYSYAPEKPAYYASVADTVGEVERFGNPRVCLTGGEPLMHREKSLALLHAIAQRSLVEDVHVETNGAIDLTPFDHDRRTTPGLQSKVRFILDYKLPDSGEMDKMIPANFARLLPQDEIKFVIGSRTDFDIARDVLTAHHEQGQVLFSPVWESMQPDELAALMLEHRLTHVKLNLQLHKYIWDPKRRGV